MTDRLNVLVGLDGSKSSMRALEFAIGYAIERDAKLVLATIVEWYARLAEPGPFPVAYAASSAATDEISKALIEAARNKILNPALEKIGDRVEYDVEIETGSPPQRIVEIAEDRDCHAVVLGRGDSGHLRSAFFGGVASSVLKHAERPVFIIP